jgi:hypothetical protein
MPETTQCTNCGAILTTDDIFCGECGAPHPLLDPNAKVPAEPPAQPATPPSPTSPAPPAYVPSHPTQPSSSKVGWQVAVIILGVVGMLCCLASISCFLFGGASQTEGMAPEENWLYSTLLFLLPIGGTGLILILAAVVVWFTQLRKR